MARDFDRHVAQFRVRVGGLTGPTAPGIPVTNVVGQVTRGEGAVRPATDLNKMAATATTASVSGWQSDPTFGLSQRQA